MYHVLIWRQVIWHKTNIDLRTEAVHFDKHSFDETIKPRIEMEYTDNKLEYKKKDIPTKKVYNGL